MNEKEKDALIQVKHFNNITRYWQEEEYEEKEIKKYITTILNLIEKQQKEIERLKIKNNDLLRKLRNRIKDVKKLQKYGEYKKEFSTLNKRIERQDKMIKAMAEEIAEFRNELDLINDTKEAVMKEYEEIFKNKAEQN